MNKKWLILDCNFLCHRLKYAMGGLSHEGGPTGIIYGFLKSIPMYQEMFDTSYIIFCWDSKTSKRQEIFPEYKANRKKRFKEMSKEEVIFETKFQYQMKMLRRKYLSMIGFKNIFCQKGYEADDLIASFCLTIPDKNQIVIITSDQDLYQCLAINICIYDPNKRKKMTLQGLYKKYKIKPHEWLMLKALAGCTTDEVPGVKGIGEKTAIKYLTGELSDASKAFQKINSKIGWKIYKRNLKLVSLPFNRTKKYKLKNDNLSADGWKQVIRKLGLKSIRDKVPMGIRRKRKTK